MLSRLIHSINLFISAQAEDMRARLTKQNIREGLVVFVDGFEMGITLICFASGLSSAGTYSHLNPLNSHFYTDVYRWLLRYISA